MGLHRATLLQQYVPTHTHHPPQARLLSPPPFESTKVRGCGCVGVWDDIRPKIASTWLRVPVVKVVSLL